MNAALSCALLLLSTLPSLVYSFGLPPFGHQNSLLAHTAALPYRNEKSSNGPTTFRLGSRSRPLGQSASETTDENILSKLSNLDVFALDGSPVSLGSFLVEDSQKNTTIIACLSHFGDFNTWEVTQQYIAAVDMGKLNNCEIILIGIGTIKAATMFADDLGLALPNTESNSNIKLLVDEDGSVTMALGCYRGWLAIDKDHAKKWPSADVNPYIKLFGMIFGFGSPGTIGRVLYGYVGDKDGNVLDRKWVVDALLYGSQKGRFPKLTRDAFEGVAQLSPSLRHLFGLLHFSCSSYQSDNSSDQSIMPCSLFTTKPPHCRDSGLRPFELATLRAQTGIHIVLNWKTFGPNDGDLFTRYGGTFIFRGNQCIYEYFDKGILTYAPIEEVVSAVEG